MKRQQVTYKKHLERLNKVLLYIQAHLDEDIELAQLAELSHFSKYHFHRIFTAFMNEPLHTYIRRLKMQRAASELVYSKLSITDIALNAGFESSSFSKAFKQVMGLTPKALRTAGALPEFTPPCFDNPLTSGETMMNPMIKNIAPKTVLYVRRHGDYFVSGPEAWKTLLAYVNEHGLVSDNLELIGVTHDDPAVTKEAHWRFDACIAGLDNPTPDGEVGVQTIAGGKYAVFEHRGPYHTLGDTYKQIFRQWYPNTDVTLRDEPPFSHYVDRRCDRPYGELSETAKAQCLTHVYIPIV